MVDITPLISAGSQVIQAYAPGCFRISGQVYSGAVIVFPDKTEIWDFSGDASAVQPENFKQILDRLETLDLILLGSGVKASFAPPALRKFFSEKGVSLDVMGTGAACRTYNVLLAEGRRVAAALIPL